MPTKSSFNIDVVFDNLRHNLSPELYYAVPVAFITLWILWAHLKRTSGPPGFPGPAGRFILGNVGQEGKNPWLKYTEWNKQFGPIYGLNFMGQPAIVVGSAKAASDLLDRRSAIYSDRPRFTMATEILTGGLNLAFARYGDRWRKMRRAARDGLSVKASEEYITLQEKEAIFLMDGLMNEKGNIDPQLRRTAAATVLGAVYAYPPIGINDPIVHRVENYVDRMLKAAIPGNYVVDIFPWMLNVPEAIAKWKREGLAWFRKDTELFKSLIEDTKTGLSDGTRSDCFVRKLLETSSQHGLDSVETAWLAGMMFGAGAEAMAATLGFFIVAMLINPEVQTKLRAEIDAAVPPGTPFPTFANVKNLPYLNSVIKETLRWRPMGPLAVPHASMQDDIYEGHFIKAGTIIIPNVWAMHHDENVYPDPDRFWPERFLEADGVTARQFSDAQQGHHTFGFGRRACIGYPVAINALKINAANIIYCFNVNRAKNAAGHEIVPDKDAYINMGLAVKPLPFDCAMVPRSTSIAQQIKKSRDSFK